jgi:hypothetical protein
MAQRDLSKTGIADVADAASTASTNLAASMPNSIAVAVGIEGAGLAEEIIVTCQVSDYLAAPVAGTANFTWRLFTDAGGLSTSTEVVAAATTGTIVAGIISNEGIATSDVNGALVLTFTEQGPVQDDVYTLELLTNGALPAVAVLDFSIVV